jgi:hypothetical protein
LPSWTLTPPRAVNVTVNGVVNVHVNGDDYVEVMAST